MNIKMAINSQLSTIESKKQTKKKLNSTRNRFMEMEIIWRVISWEGDGGEWRKRCRE